MEKNSASQNAIDGRRSDVPDADLFARAKEAEPPPKEPDASQSFLQRNSLKLAGYLNLVGDVGFVFNGIKTKNPYKVGGGGLYTVGALNLARYGTVNKEYTIREITERTAEFIKDNSDLPENTELAHALKHKKTDAVSQLDRILYRQPAQNTMGLYTAGAGALLGSGIHKYRTGQGISGLAYGVSSLGFKLASFTIPEDNKQEHEKGSSGFIGWIKEKPLRLFGYGSLVTDSLLAWEAYQEYKFSPKQKNYLWTGVSSGCYMVSDVLMAISYKDPNNSGAVLTQGELERIENMVAETIALQPHEQQEELTNKVSKFLIKQPQVQADVGFIRESLRNKVAQMSQGKWAERVAENTELATQHSV